MLRTTHNALGDCLHHIELKLGWGKATAWTTADFEELAGRIHEATGTLLSATTLKRVWGRIAHPGSPSPTTLDALARYVGAENWRAYELSWSNGMGPRDQATAADQEPTTTTETEEADLTSPPSDRKSTASAVKKTGRFQTVGIVMIVVFVVGALWLLSSTLLTDEVGVQPSSRKEETSFIPNKGPTALDPSEYTFHHRPLAKGVPNTVVFTYTAGAAPVDSVFIQQSWDPSRRKRVARNGSTFSSIYYLPGYYRARLLVGDQVVKERELLIPSEGWNVAILREPVPAYLPTEPLIQNGALRVGHSELAEINVSLQPDPPIIAISSVGSYGGIFSDNFEFETRLRQEYAEGTAACRNLRLLLLLKNNVIIIPLSTAGCVATLEAFICGQRLDGRTTDLSSLGVVDDDWLDMQVIGRDDLIQVLLNGQLALSVESQQGPLEIVGVRYEFTGAGAVASARLSGNGHLYEDHFGKALK